MPDENFERKTQLSLRGLMICVAILSAFLAIGAYLGFNNGFLILCAIASGILTCIFAATAPRGKFGYTTGATVVILLLLCNPMLMFFSIVMATNCIGHWLLIFLFKKRQRQVSTLQAIYASTIVALLSFCVGVAIGLPGYLKFRKELKQFEPVNVSSRLTYETEFERDQPRKIDLKSDHELRLDEYNFSTLENQSDNFFGRRWALAGLHRQRTEQFVKSPGFGVARMFPPTIDRASAPELQSIAFDELVDVDYQRHFLRHDQSSESSRADRVHETTMFDFVHPDGFGLLVEPKNFKGFVPHAFYQSPIRYNPSGFDALKLESLQLISLRRFTTPRAYDLDYLPRMDHLNTDDVATRELTAFELDAIETLKQKTKILAENEVDPTISDVVLLQDNESLVMVGALRAFNSCLECHNARKDELLGAFTYRFSKPDPFTKSDYK